MNFDTQNQNNITPQRNNFLNVLCILSFVAIGLMILSSFIMMLCLAIDVNKINEVWDQAIQANPILQNYNPATLMHGVGLMGALTLIVNLFSLMGVIMMWKLQFNGIFIYAIAEIFANFISLFVDLGAPQEQQTPIGGIIFWILIDGLFILAYYHNLKKSLSQLTN